MQFPELERILIFDNLVSQRRTTRQTELGDKQPSTAELAVELENKIISSEAFSWFGLVSGRDETDSVVVCNLHLLRRPNARLSMDTEADIEIICEDLEVAMGEVSVEILYSNKPQYPPEQFREKLLAGYAADTHWSLEFDKFL